MSVTRRRFLQMLGFAPVAAAVAPKVLLAVCEATPAAVPVVLAEVPYWQTNANSGTYAGIDRSMYPGRLSTPTLHANGRSLTPDVYRRAAKRFEEIYG